MKTVRIQRERKHKRERRGSFSVMLGCLVYVGEAEFDQKQLRRDGRCQEGSRQRLGSVSRPDRGEARLDEQIYHRAFRANVSLLLRCRAA